MSSVSFRKPDFRLALDYPTVTLYRAGDPEPVAAAALGTPEAAADLGRLGAALRQAGGRLTVVLPETEVWRDTLHLGAATPLGRRRAARAAAAAPLATTPGGVAVALGSRRADGTRPVAAVRRDTLAETRAFLARAGLRAAAIVGAGAFPGFAAPPRFGVPRVPPLAPAAGGLSAAAAALLALWLQASPEPMPPATTAALPVAAAQAVVAAPATVRPAPRPAMHRVEREPAAAPAGTRAAERPRQPIVTVATRNMPVLPAVRGQQPAATLRLAELTTARARLDDAAAVPLHRPAAPVAEEVAPAGGIRPLKRPGLVASGASAPPATAERAAAAPPASGMRPLPRPANAAQAVTNAIDEAVAEAAAQPAPLAVAALSPTAALVTSVSAGRPVPRRAAPAAAVPQPAPVVRVAPAPAVRVAPQPVRVVRAAPQPAAPQRFAKPAATRVVAAPSAVVQKKPARAERPRKAAATASAAAATQKVGLSRSSVSLIGVFGASSDRHALLRLPNGQMKRVRPGDSIQGVRIAAVGADSVRLTGSGRDTLLKLPD